MRKFITLFLILFGTAAQAKVVRYDLKITRGRVNLSGKETVPWALMVNGSIPAPTLEFTEGDEAEITVINGLEKDEEISTHWHGLLLPWTEDGVSNTNTPPIMGGESYTFRFPVRQNGTYWYHSHTMLQEQKGLYGAIVIHPREKNTGWLKHDKEAVVVLADWSDEDPDQILKNLRKDGDYYLYKKHSMRSYAGALAAGKLGNQLKNEWQRMAGMDLSDVGYDAFLINGKRDSQLLDAKPGETVRLRIVNAGASSYFYVSLGGLPFTVVAADGQAVMPQKAKELLLGMAETYDILFTVPDGRNYELRATCQDVTGYGSAWIGNGGGEKVFAETKPAPDLYATMDHSGHAGMDHSAHGGMDHSAHGGQMKMDHSKVLEQAKVDSLMSMEKTTFPKDANVSEVKLVLDGDMERYVWHINGKAIHEDRLLEVNEGDVVRFVFQNNTMMHHPMHLHGHFFRVLTGAGDFSPLKHTVDVPPHGTRTIEFHAVERGQWMLHCHNLYHMKTGMGRVIRYKSLKMTPEQQHLDHHDHHLHEHVYWDGFAEAATNHGKAALRLSKTWDTLELKAETREHHGTGKWEVEGDLLYRRWFGNFFNLAGGGLVFDGKVRGAAGAAYIFPFLVEGQALVDHKGELRFDVHRRFQWTSAVFTEAELAVRTEAKPEWEVSLMYGPSWHWAAGLMLTEEKVGFGAQVRF